jgi:DNA-binding response OmpR family regulator
MKEPACGQHRRDSQPEHSPECDTYHGLLEQEPSRLSRLVNEGRPLNEPLKILIAEDDLLVQGMLEDALTEGGFLAEILSSAEEAVTLLNSEVASFRALVTDVNLRGAMSGWDLARVARERDPVFPVVYMTGAAAGDWGRFGVPNSILLTKPFAPAQLLTAVSQLLNAGGPTA